MTEPADRPAQDLIARDDGTIAAALVEAINGAAPPARRAEGRVGGLDAAWAEAEAALPKGGKTTLTVSTLPTAFGGKVKAEAYAHPANVNYERLALGTGSTPAEALHALAAALQGEGT